MDYISTNPSYTFKINKNRKLTAVFTSSIPTYTITLSIDPAQADWGSVSGGGTFEEGSSVTVTATPAEGYQFVAWQEGGQNVSTSASYTFTATANRSLTAVFAEEKRNVVYQGKASNLSQIKSNPGSVATEKYAFFAGGAGASAGQYLSSVNCYTETLTMITTTQSLSTSRSTIASTVIGNFALFAGGANNSSALMSVDAYDDSLTRTTPKQILPSARSGSGAAAIGNHALIAGGSALSGFITEIICYDGELVRITAATGLSKARGLVKGVSLERHAIFGGGTIGSSAYSGVVDAFDDSLTRTTATSAMSVARSGYSAAAAGKNKLAVFAGGFRYGSSKYTYYNTVDVYDDALTRNTPATPLSSSRYNAGATSLGVNALFSGGYAGSNYKVTDVYDEKLTHISASDLSTSRSQPGAATIGDKALIAGGGTNVVEVYTLQ